MNESHNDNLTPKEQYDLKKKKKDQTKGKEQLKEKINATPKKIGKFILYILITVGIIGGIGWFVSLVPNLPPTSMQNHSEDSPPAHIVTERIPDSIQRHMLEHADGGTRQGDIPGIIIQYNCDDYECEPDLVQKLTALVEEYPKNVYLAPNNYDGKIILTRLGKREVLDSFDAQIIRDFIE